ncbi:unnamed protein product [Arctogadus glacialis]
MPNNTFLAPARNTQKPPDDKISHGLSIFYSGISEPAVIGHLGPASLPLPVITGLRSSAPLRPRLTGSEIFTSCGKASLGSPRYGWGMGGGRDSGEAGG